MANQLIQSISLKDEGYAKGIKSAQEALEKLGKENGVANASFRNTNREINSAKRYFTSLSAEYSKLSDEAKKSEFGRAIHQQMTQAEKDLQEMYNEAEKVNKKLKEMQETARKNQSGGFSMKQMGKDIMGKMGMGQLAEAGSLKAAAGVAGMAAGVGAAVVAYQALDSAIRNNIETAREFEKSCSSIQALTGANAETMNKLKQSAIELGGSTTQSATQVMQAFGMIGSQAPQLLEDAEALSKVTEYSIMLSEAAGIELSDAAAGVTGILNQFGLSANNAKDVVNLLAAASQKGAGNVAYLNSAITKCGSVAGALGVSTNQTVAVIEQLAQAGIDASSAGNNLKNIMLKLEASSDKNLKPSVNGLVKALQNLRDKQLSSTQMAKMFGSENVAAALTLVKTADAADKLTASITGTNTAEEQQKINNDNLDGSLKNLESKWEAFNLAINQGNGLIRSCVDATATLVGWFTKLITKTDAATEARKRFNKEMSGGKDIDNGKDGVGTQVNAVAEQDTEAKMIAQHNKIMSNYKKVVGDYNKEIKKLDSNIASYEQQIANTTDQASLVSMSAAVTSIQKKRDELAKERRSLIEDNKEFIKLSKVEIALGPKSKREKATTASTSNNSGGDEASKVKLTAAQKYADTLAQIAFKEKIMLYDEEVAAINEQKAISERIKATESYINELSKDAKSIKKNKKKIDEANSVLNKYKVRLKEVTRTVEDHTIIKNANQDYANTIDKLNTDRKNGWITEEEYNTKYIDAVKSLTDKYKTVNNVNDDLIKQINKKQKEVETYQFAKEYKQADLAVSSLIKEFRNALSGGAKPNDYYKTKRAANDKVNKQFDIYVVKEIQRENWLKTTDKQSKADYIKQNQYDMTQLGIPNFDVEAISKIGKVANASEEQIKTLNVAIDYLNKTLLGVNTSKLAEIIPTINKANGAYDKVDESVLKWMKDNAKLTSDIVNDKDIFASLMSIKSATEANEDQIKAYGQAVSNLKTNFDNSDEWINEWGSDTVKVIKENIKYIEGYAREIRTVEDAIKYVQKQATARVWLDPLQSIAHKGNIVNDRESIELLAKLKYDPKSWDAVKKIIESKGIKLNTELEAWNIDEIQKELESNKINIDQETFDALMKLLKVIDETLNKDIQEVTKAAQQTYKPDIKPNGQGDASNYSLGVRSYEAVAKRNTQYKTGRGGISAIGLQQDVTDKMQQQLDQMLERYKDAQDKLVEINQKDDSFGLNLNKEKLEGELNALGKDIDKMHDKIQSRLKFQIEVEGAKTALNGLSAIASYGNSFSSYAQSIHNWSKNWEEAGEGVDGFTASMTRMGMICDMVQQSISMVTGVIDAINTVMEISNGIQNLFNIGKIAGAAATTEEAVAEGVLQGSEDTGIGTTVAATEANKALEASTLDLAAAQIFAAHAAIPFAGVAIATGYVSAMMGAMSAQHAASLALAAFANGGIVDSGNYYGDSTLVRANKGEMILNNQEQKNLFDVLKYGIGNPMSGGEVEFKIRGQELVGLMQNYNTKKSRIR